jgi:hypothetical protein
MRRYASVRRSPRKWWHSWMKARLTGLLSVTHRISIMRHPTTLAPSPGFSIIKLLFFAASLVAALVSVLIIVTVFSTAVPYLTNGF